MIKTNKPVISLIALSMIGLASIYSLSAMEKRKKYADSRKTECFFSEVAQNVTDNKFDSDVAPKLLARSMRVGPVGAAASVGAEKMISSSLKRSRLISAEVAGYVAYSIINYTLENLDSSILRPWGYNEKCLKKFQAYLGLPSILVNLKLRSNQFINLERSCGGWKTLSVFSEGLFRNRINAHIIESAKNSWKKHFFGLLLRIGIDMGEEYISNTLESRGAKQNALRGVEESFQKLGESAEKVGHYLGSVLCPDSQCDQTSNNMSWGRFLQNLSDGINNQLLILEEQHEHKSSEGILSEYKDFCFVYFVQMLGSLKQFKQDHIFIQDYDKWLSLEEAHEEALEVIQELLIRIQCDIAHRIGDNRALNGFALLLQKNHEGELNPADDTLDFWADEISGNKILQDVLLLDTSEFMCKCLVSELEERLQFIRLKKEESRRVQESNS